MCVSVLRYPYVRYTIQVFGGEETEEYIFF